MQGRGSHSKPWVPSPPLTVLLKDELELPSSKCHKNPARCPKGVCSHLPQAAQLRELLEEGRCGRRTNPISEAGTLCVCLASHDAWMKFHV